MTRERRVPWTLAVLVAAVAIGCHSVPPTVPEPANFAQPAEKPRPLPAFSNSAPEEVRLHSVTSLRPEWSSFQCEQDLDEGPLWACDAVDMSHCGGRATVRFFVRGRLFRPEQEVDVFLLDCAPHTFVGVSAPGMQLLRQLQLADGEQYEYVFIPDTSTTLARLLVVTNGEGGGQRWARIENVELDEEGKGLALSQFEYPGLIKSVSIERQRYVVVLSTLIEQHCCANGSKVFVDTPVRGKRIVATPEKIESAHWGQRGALEGPRISLSGTSFSVGERTFSLDDAALEEKLDAFVAACGGLGVPRITATVETVAGSLKELARRLARYGVTSASLELSGTIRHVRFHVPYLDDSLDGAVELAPNKIILAPTAGYWIVKRSSGLNAELARLGDSDGEGLRLSCAHDPPMMPIVIELVDRSPLSVFAVRLGACPDRAMLVETRPSRAPSKRKGVPHVQVPARPIEVDGVLTVAEVQSVLEVKADEILACYRQGLKLDPEARGILELLVTTSERGETILVGLGPTSSLYSAPIEKCVEQVFRTISYHTLKTGEPGYGSASVSLAFSRQE